MSQIMRIHRILTASLVLLLLSNTNTQAAQYVPKSVKALAARVMAAMGYGASCYSSAKTENEPASRAGQSVTVARSAVAPVTTASKIISAQSTKTTTSPKPAIPDFDQAKFQKVREKWQRRLENEEQRLRIISGVSAEDLDPKKPENVAFYAASLAHTGDQEINDFCSLTAYQDPQRIARFHPLTYERINNTLRLAGLVPASITLHQIKPVSYTTKLKAQLGYHPDNSAEVVDLKISGRLKGANWCFCALISGNDPKRSAILINKNFHSDRPWHELEKDTACVAAGCLKRSQIYEHLLLHEACHIQNCDAIAIDLAAYKKQSPVLAKAWQTYTEKRADFKSVLSCSNPLGVALALANNYALGYEHRGSPAWQELCDDLKACFSAEFLAQHLNNRKSPYIFDFEKPIEPLLVIEPKDLR